jgi:hypothetical protein
MTPGLRTNRNLRFSCCLQANALIEDDLLAKEPITNQKRSRLREHPRTPSLPAGHNISVAMPTYRYRSSASLHARVLESHGETLCKPSSVYIAATCRSGVSNADALMASAVGHQAPSRARRLRSPLLRGRHPVHHEPSGRAFAHSRTTRVSTSDSIAQDAGPPP